MPDITGLFLQDPGDAAFGFLRESDADGLSGGGWGSRDIEKLRTHLR
jgi:hypothetical protein